MAPVSPSVGHVKIQERNALGEDILVENVRVLWVEIRLALVEELTSPWLEPTTTELRHVGWLRRRHLLKPLVVVVNNIPAGVRVGAA